MVKKFRLPKFNNTQILILALASSLIFIVVFVIFFTPNRNSTESPITPIPTPINNSSPAPIDAALIPEARFWNVNLETEVVGQQNPTAAQLLAGQSQIIGHSDLNALGASASLLLSDGIRNYANLNPPPFIYQLVIPKNTLHFDPNTGGGDFALLLVNQQNTPDPDIRYNVTFTLEPAAMNFTKL